MKRFSVIILTFILMLTGCVNQNKKDLFNYINAELPPVVEMENDALEKYNNLISNNNYTYDTFYTALKNEIIPTYEDFLNKLTKISPKTKDLKEIHNLYIEGAKYQLKALKLLQKGIEEKDNELLLKSSEFLKKSKKYMTEYKNKIVTLAEKYHMEYKLD
ncbi:hypothetical protein SAMN02745135_02246 [Caloranaerobacter azorensis DSM 13643]|uniref:Lipoprotein n=1 Tax=Caloranaerobacter azorensis DSM 13643 TaxID=1121264 RepID=A0A1M5W1P5_9FIRM|nr:hypothetical protein [Caloranaerobacter azorensis]SHH81432.1 hypothetical protein SAMN02745135_02246 [Caloranaerobacter azorensis DSM 13643]